MIGLNNIVPMMGKIANAGVAEGIAIKVKPSLVAPDNKIYSLDIVADSFEVDWGDGVVDSAMAHTYADGDSEYTVQVTGTNITKLSQGTTITNNGRALTALLRMNLPNLTNTDNMFGDASNIHDWSNLALPEGLASIGVYAFQNCSSLALTSLPVGLGSIGDYAFSYCSSLALTSLPVGLGSIGDYAFSYCPNLALTSLPSGVTRIGYYAFSDCSSLSLTSLPEGLTSILTGVFRNCSSLALTSLPAGLTSIEYGAFMGCSNLALTSLPVGLASIGVYAFQNCSSLALTSLPAGLTSIEYSAFMGCSNLADVVFLGTPDNIDGNAFGGTSANLYVPWPAGAVTGAPWGTSGTITYNYVV